MALQILPSVDDRHAPMTMQIGGKAKEIAIQDCAVLLPEPAVGGKHKWN